MLSSGRQGDGDRALRGDPFRLRALRERFLKRIPGTPPRRPSSIGADATMAAWDKGQPWLDQVMAHLLRARDHLGRPPGQGGAEVRVHAPRGHVPVLARLPQLDLPVPAFEFFHARAKLASAPARASSRRATSSSGSTSPPRSRSSIRSSTHGGGDPRPEPAMTARANLIEIDGERLWASSCARARSASAVPAA